ncbi:hypothetical protein AC739_11695 [Planococcus glaciei]|nr:hypothetical protein AC739_11695 [Planococcus glaciei]
MEEAYRQRYTERDIMDWICVFKNKIAIMPHLFLQVTIKILQTQRRVKVFLSENRNLFNHSGFLLVSIEKRE